MAQILIWDADPRAGEEHAFSRRPIGPLPRAASEPMRFWSLTVYRIVEYSPRISPGARHWKCRARLSAAPPRGFSFFLLHLRMQMNSFHCRSSKALTDCTMNTLTLLYISHSVPLFSGTLLSAGSLLGWCSSLPGSTYYAYYVTTVTPAALLPSYKVLKCKMLFTFVVRHVS